jgi:hypothetical protein
MPINVQDVRRKIDNHEPISIDEIQALFEAEGLFIGHRVIRTTNGLIVALGPLLVQQGQQQNQGPQQLGPRIEITENRIRGIGTRGSRAFARQLALMARVRFGEGETVGVRGDRHLRAACRALGLVVVNKNNAVTIAWSFARNTMVMRRLPRRGPRRPVPFAPGPALEMPVL